MSDDDTQRRLGQVESVISRHTEQIALLTERIGTSETGITSTIKELKKGQQETNRELDQIKKLLYIGIFLVLGKEGILHILKL